MKSARIDNRRFPNTRTLLSALEAALLDVPGTPVQIAAHQYNGEWHLSLTLPPVQREGHPASPGGTPTG